MQCTELSGISRNVILFLLQIALQIRISEICTKLYVHKSHAFRAIRFATVKCMQNKQIPFLRRDVQDFQTSGVWHLKFV